MNKELIFKGLSRLFIAILFAFTGPVIYTSAVRNEDHPFFIPVLGLGLIACILAILVWISGDKTPRKGFL